MGHFPILLDGNFYKSSKCLLPLYDVISKHKCFFTSGFPIFSLKMKKKALFTHLSDLRPPEKKTFCFQSRG